MKKGIVLLSIILCLTSCQGRKDYVILDDNKYYFHVDDNNEKYLIADVYPCNIKVDITFNYPRFVEKEIPEGASKEEIEKITSDNKFNSSNYYFVKNFDLFKTSGLYEEFESYYVYSWDKKITVTYDMDYYKNNIKSKISQMQETGLVIDFVEQETYDYNSITRINPDYYGLLDKNRIDNATIVHSKISFDENNNWWFLPYGVYFNEKDLIQAVENTFDIQSWIDFHKEQIESYKLNFNKYIYLIYEPIVRPNGLGLSVSDVYLQDNKFYILFETIDRVNFVNTKSTIIEQRIIRINRNFINKNNDYEIIKLY